MNLNELHICAEADEAEAWAVQREFDMRYAHIERSRLGLAAVVKRTAESMKRLNVLLSGDPDAPDPLASLRVRDPE